MPIDGEVERWYALYCAPNMERQVADGLDSLGLGYFYPWYNERVRTSQRGRYRDIQRSYYPRYCFGRAKPSRTCDLASLRGVSYIVGCPADVPWPIPDRFMNMLIRTALPTGEILIGKKKRKRYKTGDKVKVVDDLSPLQGLMLTIVSDCSIMLKSETDSGLKVEIPIGSVEAVKDK